MLLSTVSAAALMLAAPAPQDEAHLMHVVAPEDPAVEIAEVLVTGRRDPLNAAVVAQARAAAQETPGAVAVVSREQYADHLAMHLGDLHRRVLGRHDVHEMRPVLGCGSRQHQGGGGDGGEQHGASREVIRSRSDRASYWARAAS